MTLPRDLALFLALAAPRFADFTFAAETGDFARAFAAAKRSAAGRARLFALIAGAVPFGTARDGAIAILALGDGVVGKVDPSVPGAPKLVARDVSTFALALALENEGSDDARALRAKLPAPRVAEQESVRAAFERARAVVDLVIGDDAAVRRAARKLAHRPLDVPPPAPPPSSRRAGSGPRVTASRKKPDRETPLALGALIEAFFRQSEDEARAACAAHRASSDAVVASAATVLGAALDATKTRRTPIVRELARRRKLAIEALTKVTRSAKSSDRLALTRGIVAAIDALRDVVGSSGERDEALLALGELGDPAIVPSLAARAVTGDLAAVDMLAALGAAAAVPHLEALLHREPPSRPGARQLEAAVVRALATLDAKHAAPTLRALLDASPMRSWRDGINLGAFVKELVAALGALRDAASSSALLAVLEETSQEYRAVAPTAAWALGRLRHVPALATLERRLLAPKDAVTCEAVWAVGEIGSAADATTRRRAIALVEGLARLEPGAEIVRAVALAKMGAGPRAAELRRTLDRALWEPAFRQEETSRRRAWALEA
ncbi:MAG TPA: hypothetical protein VIF62_39830, partial [Labilithrix sp.]